MKQAADAAMETATSGSLEQALINFGELRFTEFSRGRNGEEREWLEQALFYQRRQWLEWDDDKKNFIPQKQDKRKPRPMPVSNYFAKTVNANANALGIPKISATPRDDSPENRRAADMAEKAREAADKESGFNLQAPLLAKHTALWGIGVTKDTIDTSASTGVEDFDEEELSTEHLLGCNDCGGQYVIGKDEGMNPTQNTGATCPQCNSTSTQTWKEDTPVVTGNYRSAKGRIKTEVRPIFELFFPRDCQGNPNLSDILIQRYGTPKSRIRKTYGEKKAKELKGGTAGRDVEQSQSYIDALRSLVNYNYMQDASGEQVTLSELWCTWDEIPRKLQKAIVEEYEEESQETPDELAIEEAQGVKEDDDDDDIMANAKDDPNFIECCQKYGIFLIWAGDTVLDWGCNPNYSEDDPDKPSFNPFTFFLWELDPASPYPKGVGADLIPLQKHLNRIDSLIDLACMTNGVGKWLWPKTQSNSKPPSGDPSDVAEYDPLGDAKHKPEFVMPNPFSQAVWQVRLGILADFKELGYQSAVANGDAGGAQAFRAIAYLGAKASEQLNTQRYLWETSHKVRYEKVLFLAKEHWDTERMIRVAGQNGKFYAETMLGDDLDGAYDIDYVQDSSIPKTLDEKIQAFTLLLQAGLVDPSDPATRQYVLDLIGLEGLNLADELQYRKAHRDLEKVKSGDASVIESPYQKWDVFLRIFSQFTLTEEYEMLPAEIQSLILVKTEEYNQKMTEVSLGGVAGAAGAGINQMGAQMAAAFSGQPGAGMGDAGAKANPGGTLNKVPGEQTGTGNVQTAAETQGAAVAKAAGA